MWAHEIGTSRVFITFTAEGNYVIEVTADAAALLARLETLSGRPRSGSLPRDSYPDRIASLAPALLAHADVRFDEVAARPAFETARNEPGADAESELRPPAVTVRLRGAVPAGARAVTWHYDLTSASYALTMRPSDGGAERIEWLEGDQVGQPFALGRDTRTVADAEPCDLTDLRSLALHEIPARSWSMTIWFVSGIPPLL